MFDEGRPYVGAAMFFERCGDGDWTEDEEGMPLRRDTSSVEMQGTQLWESGLRFIAGYFSMRRSGINQSNETKTKMASASHGKRNARTIAPR